MSDTEIAESNKTFDPLSPDVTRILLLRNSVEPRNLFVTLDDEGAFNLTAVQLPTTAGQSTPPQRVLLEGVDIGEVVAYVLNQFPQNDIINVHPHYAAQIGRAVTQLLDNSVEYMGHLLNECSRSWRLTYRYRIAIPEGLDLGLQREVSISRIKEKLPTWYDAVESATVVGLMKKHAVWQS